jgi:dTDP-4-dehydrorhamnose 3,5-epimerase
LHYQVGEAVQGKLVTVLAGRVWDVAVDLRRDLPSFGQWAGVELSAESGQQLYVPEGCAHGFLAMSDDAVVHYKCTTYWSPEAERTIRWDDPALGIAWPLDRLPHRVAGRPILSDKDAAAPTLNEMDSGDLP